MKHVTTAPLLIIYHMHTQAITCIRSRVVFVYSYFYAYTKFIARIGILVRITYYAYIMHSYLYIEANEIPRWTACDV